MKTSIEQLAKCDWEQMERDVVTRIRVLAATARHLEPNELTDKIANDLLLPNLRLLGEFCANVELTDEDE